MFSPAGFWIGIRTEPFLTYNWEMVENAATTRTVEQGEYEEVITTGIDTETGEVKPKTPPQPIDIWADNRTYVGRTIELHQCWTENAETDHAQRALDHRMAYEDWKKILDALYPNGSTKIYSVMQTARDVLEARISKNQGFTKSEYQSVLRDAWLTEGIVLEVEGLQFFNELLAQPPVKETWVWQGGDADDEEITVRDGCSLLLSMAEYGWDLSIAAFCSNSRVRLKMGSLLLEKQSMVMSIHFVRAMNTYFLSQDLLDRQET
jgi:hypothetical protein